MVETDIKYIRFDDEEEDVVKTNDNDKIKGG